MSIARKALWAALVATTAAPLAAIAATPKPKPPEVKQETTLYQIDAQHPAPPAGHAGRASAALFADCGLPAGAGGHGQPGIPAFVIGLFVTGFKLLLNAANKQAEKEEDANIASLSNNATATLTAPSFPLEQGDAGVRCLVLERADVTKEDTPTYLGGSTYVFRLENVGAKAFTIELVGAEVTHSDLLADPKHSKKLNADVALAITTIEPGGDGRVERVSLPAYTASVEGIEARKPGRPEGERRISLVMPLPPRGTPASIVASVTESNADLKSYEERIAVQRSVRKKLIEMAGTALEAATAE